MVFIINLALLIFKDGNICNFNVGIINYGVINMSNGNISDNTTGINNNGILSFTGGVIKQNSKYDINHNFYSKDSYGGLRIERNDTVVSKIYLANSDSYIYTGSKLPILSSITLGKSNLERKIIRTSNTTNAATMVNKITVANKGSYYCKANASGYSNYVVLWINYNVITYHKTLNGVLLDSSSKTYAYKDKYTTTPGTFEEYDLSSTPTNSTGSVTDNISVTYYYTKTPNVAVVNYSDALSGIQTALYWYNSTSNSFSGSGTSFENGKIFEKYGYYKIVVTDKCGLSKTITFNLNENSI